MISISSYCIMYAFFFAIMWTSTAADQMLSHFRFFVDAVRLKSIIISRNLDWTCFVQKATQANSAGIPFQSCFESVARKTSEQVTLVVLKNTIRLIPSFLLYAFILWLQLLLFFVIPSSICAHVLKVFFRGFYLASFYQAEDSKTNAFSKTSLKNTDHMRVFFLKLSQNYQLAVKLVELLPIMRLSLE